MTVNKLKRMELHQVIDLGSVDWLMRVPGGCIYYHRAMSTYEETAETTTATFVPFPAPGLDA